VAGDRASGVVTARVVSAGVASGLRSREHTPLRAQHLTGARAG
jgi:hypothetical protein